MRTAFSIWQADVLLGSLCFQYRKILGYHHIIYSPCLVAVAMIFLPEKINEALRNSHAIFWMEAIGIWAFSAYWYIKSRELDQTLSFIPLRRKPAEG